MEGGILQGNDSAIWRAIQSAVGFVVTLIQRRSRAVQPNEDQSSATTVTAISAVPAHPKKVSTGLALKRPITERRVTTTIITAMIGTATAVLHDQPQIKP
jgi:hypothetical protein